MDLPNPRHWSASRLASGRVLLGAALLTVASACSVPEYEVLTAEADFTGAYVVAFQVACNDECGSGRVVYLVPNISDDEAVDAMVGSVPADVRIVDAPISVRPNLEATEVAIVYSVEEAVIEDDVVAVVRIGRSEVTDVSTYRGADYQLSLEFGGDWVLRTPEETGITVTTSVS